MGGSSHIRLPNRTGLELSGNRHTFFYTLERHAFHVIAGHPVGDVVVLLRDVIYEKRDVEIALEVAEGSHA